MPKRQAVRLWHDARRFERQTRQPGKQDGALGRNGLAVLQTLLFDFIDHATGRCDPARATIAAKACISLRSVDRGLARLKAAGVVDWLKRCAEEIVEGRFCLRQLSSMYWCMQCAGGLAWLLAPGARPAAYPEAWCAPAVPDALTAACAEQAAGTGLAGVLAAMESDPGDALAAALARLGRMLKA